MEEIAVLDEVRWRGVQTVLLDMDGTLLDLAFDNFFWQELIPATVAARLGIDEAQAKAQVFAGYRARAGTLDWYCLDHWQDTLGIDLVALKREHLHRVGLLPGVDKFLTVLRQSALRSLIATNAHGTTLALKLQQTRLEREVDEVHCSHDYGAAKEQPAFWQRFTAAAAIDPASAMLIDDNVAALKAARAYGIGQVVAICQPDSTRAPSSPPPGIVSVDGVGALTPSLSAHVRRSSG